jgi:hypothetical protein
MFIIKPRYRIIDYNLGIENLSCTKSNGINKVSFNFRGNECRIIIAILVTVYIYLGYMVKIKLGNI